MRGLMDKLSYKKQATRARVKMSSIEDEEGWEDEERKDGQMRG